MNDYKQQLEFYLSSSALEEHDRIIINKVIQGTRIDENDCLRVIKNTNIIRVLQVKFLKLIT